MKLLLSLLPKLSLLFHSFYFHRTSFVFSFTNHQYNIHVSSFVRKERLNSSMTVRNQRSNDENQSSSNDDMMSFVIDKVGSSTSVVVSFTFFSVLAMKRDAIMVSYFIGSILNAIIGKILKKVLNQDRPDVDTNCLEKPNDKGCPSSHAVSLGFIGTLTVSSIPQLTLPLLLYVWVSLHYRIKRKLHTTNQIFVGLLLGISNAYLWKGLTFGTCSFLPSIYLEETISNYLLPHSGTLPMKFLFIPVIVGIAVVGSIERRIGKVITSWKEDMNVKSI